MALFSSLNDEFESHSGQPQSATVYVPPHYNIRSFHGTDLTVPRTMPDFRYFNVNAFNGQSMITLSTPRSVVGRSIAAHVMSDIDAETLGQLDAQTIQDIELNVLQSGDEGWPAGDPDVTVGKNATYRYANTISVNLTSGVTKTVTSLFRDNLLTDFPVDGSTYFIELALPAFPAQAAGTHLDLANSWIDFSSDPGFAAGQTDSFNFASSLNSLTAGGNTFWRINRNSITHADLSSIQGIRFRLKSVGNMTFVAQSMRLYRSGDFTFPSTAIDTKRNLLRRSVPEASSAATEPTTGQGLRLFSGTRPQNVTEVIRFNSGHNPVGNDNYFAMYFRYNATNQNAIRVELKARSTQSQLVVSEQSNGVAYSTLYTSPTNTNILTPETDYYLRIELHDTQVRASIYQARGAFFGPLVYSSDWRTVALGGRGLVVYDFNPYTYDFSLDYIKATAASFGAYESADLAAVTPIQGAMLYPRSSPPDDLSEQNFIPSGDAVVTTDPTFGDPAPSFKFVRDGSSFYGGWQTRNFNFVGDPHHLTVSGKLYPLITANRNYRILLIDKYDTVAWIAYIQGLKAGQWNEFEIPINATIAPANYRFVLQEVGFYADTFWVQDLKLNHDTIAWMASPNSGDTWYNFYSAVGKPYAGVNFHPVDYRSIVLDAKPSAYYRLGDVSTPAVEEQGGPGGVVGANVITGITGVVTDSTNRAMSFPGNSGGFITVGDAPQFSFANNKFAIEFWMKAADTSTAIGVIGKGNTSSNFEYSIYASSPGVMTFNTTTATGTAVYPQITWNYDTSWHHVVFQADGTRAYVFVDGDLVSVSTKSVNNMSDTSSVLTIGTANSTTPTAYYMKGFIDEVAIYPAPLSDDVITTHYQTALAAKIMTSLKVRAEALSDTAWIEGYEVFPRYDLYGHLSTGATIKPPPSVISATSSTTRDLRVFGLQVGPVYTKDLRITGLGSSTPTTRDVRITGQLVSPPYTQDIRVFGTTGTSYTQDIRVVGTATASTATRDVRVVGATATTFGLDLRVVGPAFTTTSLDFRITGGVSTTDGTPVGLLLALTTSSGTTGSTAGTYGTGQYGTATYG